MLLGILYSEFDVVAGPVIRVQAPNNLLSQEVFESISDYVITGKQLCGRTITAATSYSHLQIMGVPLYIENEKYARNALFFNVSFVFDAQETGTSSYEPILRKLAMTLYTMEIESEFLFKPPHKNTLGKVLEKVLHDLNEKGECFLPLDDANMLSLKLARLLPEPPQVLGHEVPVFLRDPEVLKSLDWDLALKQVIPAIDGVKYAKRLALETEMDEDCVKKALRTLVYYEIIALVDVFQFSNIYVTTDGFSELVRNSALQRKCQSFVCTSRVTLLPIPQLLRLYAACRPGGTTVADVVIAHREDMDKVDPRRFITFGVVYGILRRVHRYPICCTNTSRGGGGGSGASSRLGAGGFMITHKSSSSTSLHALAGGDGGGGNGGGAFGGASVGSGGGWSTAAALARQVQEMMDGTHTMDELCCNFMMAPQALEDIIIAATSAAPPPSSSSPWHAEGAGDGGGGAAAVTVINIYK